MCGIERERKRDVMARGNLFCGDRRPQTEEKSITINLKKNSTLHMSCILDILYKLRPSAIYDDGKCQRNGTSLKAPLQN